MSRNAQATQNLLTRLTPAMAEEFRRTGLWADTTIFQAVQQNAQRGPERPAVWDRHGVVSYRTLVNLAEAVAAELELAGLQPGNRVAAWLSSRREAVVFLLACSRNGTCSVRHFIAPTPSVKLASCCGACAQA